jgi:DNA-binding CsgD family transcriptional regulator
MTARMLQGGYLSILEAKTPLDFRKEVIQFAESLGFNTVSAMTVIDRSAVGPEFHVVDNTPVAYTQAYHDTGLARVDPVMQHCKRAAVPIIWDQGTYVDKGCGDMWEHQASYGYRTGIALAIHLPGGRHFSMGVDRDRALSSNPKALTRIVAELQLFAVHAQDAAFRIFEAVSSAPPSELPPLTPREKEALRWTMEGKTAWEVGAIMSISERTAVLHLQNATHKLQCINKHQAVLKALKLGLLS